MDRLIHTALNSIANLRDTRVISAQNLANQNVPGFRRDLTNEGGAQFLDMLDQATGRAFQTERGPHGFSAAPGFMNQTGEPMDVAIADAGYFLVQPAQGDPALTRRGDLRVTAQGELRNGAGDAMLDIAGQPVLLPPFRSLVIDDLGRIVIEPLANPGQPVVAATLATATGDGLDLRKSADGAIRPASGGLPAPDQQARILQGVLEGSNVNTMEELVASIDLQRSFELNLRMISTAKELDEGGARLMRMPDA